jgi:hypothetical protein
MKDPTFQEKCYGYRDCCFFPVFIMKNAPAAPQPPLGHRSFSGPRHNANNSPDPRKEGISDYRVNRLVHQDRCCDAAVLCLLA